MKRILVVEDEPLIAADLASTLEDLGFEVSGIARTVAEAQRQFIELRPDLITLDVNLGGGREGLDIAVQVRAEGPTPIVFVTGQAERDIAQFALTLGRAAVALKPFNTESLAQALRSVIA